MAVGLKVLRVIFSAAVVGAAATEVVVTALASIPRLAASGKPPFTADAFNSSGSGLSTFELLS